MIIAFLLVRDFFPFFYQESLPLQLFNMFDIFTELSVCVKPDFFWKLTLKKLSNVFLSGTHVDRGQWRSYSGIWEVSASLRTTFSVSGELCLGLCSHKEQRFWMEIFWILGTKPLCLNLTENCLVCQLQRKTLLKSVELSWQTGPYGKCWKNSSLDYSGFDGQKLCVLSSRIFTVHDTVSRVYCPRHGQPQRRIKMGHWKYSAGLKEPVRLHFSLFIETCSFIPEHIICAQADYMNKTQNSYTAALWPCGWNCRANQLHPSNWLSGCPVEDVDMEIKDII